MWIGYCMVIDAGAYVRTGTSIWNRSRWAFIRLFLISAPVWWIFELLNLRTKSWFFLGSEHYTVAEYLIFSTLSFSAVIPALFETAEFFTSFGPKGIRPPRSSALPSPQTLNVMTSAGLASVVLILLLPTIFFPLIWIVPFLLFEPMNVKRGRPSIVVPFVQGSWRPLFALALAGIWFGFFMELWNSMSFPRWAYSFPGNYSTKIFALPLVGYAGYLALPFSVHAAYHFIVGTLRMKELTKFIDLEIIEPPGIEEPVRFVPETK